jgi:hypothetical protein
MEVVEKYRERGQMPSEQHGNIPVLFVSSPICAAAVKDFTDDLERIKDTKTVLQMERECASFIRWRRGLSPGWHQQMRLFSQVCGWLFPRTRPLRGLICVVFPIFAALETWHDI